MHEWMIENYLWIKAFHILAVIAWMAGLLYLPRLFAYHHRFEVGTEAYDTFVQMERRLLRIIILPATLAVFALGVMLLFVIDPWKAGWWHTKLLALVFLFGYHGMLSRWSKDFMRGVKPYSEKFFRIINEVPFILAIIIVIMAVVKPF